MFPFLSPSPSSLLLPGFLLFLTVSSLLSVYSVGISSSGWCSYGCGSLSPSIFGVFGLNTGFDGFPVSNKQGYELKDVKKICQADTFLTNTLVGQPSIGERGIRNSEHFFLLCPEQSERTINFVRAQGLDGEVVVDFTTTIPGPAEDEVVSFVSAQGLLLIVTENNVFLYEMFRPLEEALELKWEYAFPGSEGKFTGLPLISSKFIAVNAVVGAAGEESMQLFKIPLRVDAGEDLSSSAEILSLAEPNLLDYSVISKSNDLYYCSTSGVTRISSGTGEQTTLRLATNDTDEAGCSALILASDLTLTVAVGSEQSRILEVPLQLFDSTYQVGQSVSKVNAITRVAWTDSDLGRVSYLALSTDAGVEMMVEQSSVAETGQQFAFIPTTESVKMPTTMTGLAQPVVFTNEGVFAYTQTYTVKFFTTSVSNDTNSEFSLSELELFSSPLLLAKVTVVGLTRKGEVLLFSFCNRYKVGAEVPDKACPIPDLPDAPEIPIWLTIVAGSSAVLALPMFSEYICKKMKLTGGKKLEDVELWSDEEEEEKQLQVKTRNDAEELILAPKAHPQFTK